MSASKPLPASGTTHTPGPWRLLDGLRPRKTSNFDKSYRLAVLAPKDENGNVPNVAYAIAQHAGEAEANARLIASAPDLLEALKRVERVGVETLEVFQTYGRDARAVCQIFGEALVAARAAIAKATGAHEERVSGGESK